MARIHTRFLKVTAYARELTLPAVGVGLKAVSDPFEEPGATLDSSRGSAAGAPTSTDVLGRGGEPEQARPENQPGQGARRWEEGAD